MRYRNVSGHSEDLTGGRVVGDGEYVELSDEEAKDQFNKEKISSGAFIEAPEVSAEEVPSTPSREELLAEAKRLDISGRSTMRNDELQTAINQANEEQGGSR